MQLSLDVNQASSVGRQSSEEGFAKFDALWVQVNDAMLKEDRRWMSDRQRLNATFSMFIKRMESLVSFPDRINFSAVPPQTGPPLDIDVLEPWPCKSSVAASLPAR
jgi:hypothetical protein